MAAVKLQVCGYPDRPRKGCGTLERNPQADLDKRDWRQAVEGWLLNTWLEVLCVLGSGQEGTD